MELDYEKIGQRIKVARTAKGYTQYKLAKVTNISQAHIGHIEVGSTKLALPTLIKIANALDTTADTLLFDSLPAAIDTYDVEFKELTMDCSPEEKEHLLEIIRVAKKGFDLNKQV